MSISKYDLVILGAGIHGAGVAQAAAVKGYKVLVIEKNKVAAGSSSRSSKLIHGGLRYLENFQFRLVFECIKERQLLLVNASEIVTLSPVFIPIYKNSLRSSLKIRVGLTLYSILGLLKKNTYFKKVPKKSWPSLDGLCTTDLVAVYQFYDALTDDVKLTHAVIQSAKNYGAELVLAANLLRVSRLTTDSSYQLTYMLENSIMECETPIIVNATGQWVNEVLDIISPDINKIKIDLIQGAHIIINKKLDKGIYYTDSPADGRAIFFIPWYNKTLIGTTESLFDGDLNNVSILDKEIDYLLCNYNHYFSRAIPKNRNDISSMFAGLRVLMPSSDNVFIRNRDTHIGSDAQFPGVLTICGGKLTAYRLTAERVMTRLAPFLPTPMNNQSTENIKL